MFGALGIIGTAAVFALQPKGKFFLWDADDAAAGILSLLHVFAKKTAPDLTIDESALPKLEMLPTLVRAVLCFMAGPLSGLLLASAMRFVRAHRLQQDPPEWAVAQMKPTWLESTRMNIALVMPAVAALTWTGPLFKEALGLNDVQAAGAQAGAALLTGIFFLSSCRVVLQRYLDTALLAWHTFKHGARRNERSSVAEIIQLNATAVRRLVVKAAVQALAPGVLYLAFGLALGGLWAHPAGQNSDVGKDIGRIVSCFIGFATWWSGVTWIVYCSGAIWLFRTGTMQN